MVSGKTLPCFPAWDWPSRAGGLVIDCFLTGLHNYFCLFFDLSDILSFPKNRQRIFQMLELLANRPITKKKKEKKLANHHYGYILDGHLHFFLVNFTK